MQLSSTLCIYVYVQSPIKETCHKDKKRDRVKQSNRQTYRRQMTNVNENSHIRSANISNTDNQVKLIHTADSLTAEQIRLKNINQHQHCI